MIEFGGSSPLRLFRPTVPNCCKMWFPMVETGGNRITDIAGAAVYSPSVLEPTVPYAVRIATSSQQPLVSGVFPTIGTKDFILMSVYHHDSDPTWSGITVRPEATLQFYNSGAATYSTFDGDGIALYNSAGLYQAGTETLCGASGDGVVEDDACHAMIRNGVSVGNWMQNNTWNLVGSVLNDHVVGGEVFARTMRVAGWSGGDATTYGVEDMGRNDLGVSNEVVDSYRTDASGASITTQITYQEGLGHITGGMPGVWVSTGTVQDIATPNTLQVGVGFAAHIHYYGIALFVFDDGLPSDFKEALRWMRDQWIAGNKVIWPAWADL